MNLVSTVGCHHSEGLRSGMAEEKKNQKFVLVPTETEQRAVILLDSLSSISKTGGKSLLFWAFILQYYRSHFGALNIIIWTKILFFPLCATAYLGRCWHIINQWIPFAVADLCQHGNLCSRMWLYFHFHHSQKHPPKLCWSQFSDIGIKSVRVGWSQWYLIFFMAWNSS